MSAEARPIVETSPLRFRFDAGAFELRTDPVRIEPGQHTACTGPSGCGKTTLLRLLTGILTPHEGELWLDGRALHGANDRLRRAARLASVGMVFQDFKLLEHLTALENATLPARLSRNDLRRAADRARSLADSLGVAHTLSRKPARLSQGERQRIAICRALVNEPALLVGDEPTGNLDPKRARATIELMRAEADKRNATMLVVTHDHSLLDLFEQVIDLGGAA